MRPEKELLIASKPFTIEDRARSWRAVVGTLAVIAGLAAATALLPWPIAVGCAVLQGLVVVRGFCLFHDFQHGALLRGSGLARGIFGVYGALLLVPPTVWRETHNYHHAHNAQLVGSHIGGYPMLTVRMYEGLSPAQRWLYRAARHPLNIAAAVLTVFAIGMCARPFLRAPKKHWQGLAALLLVAGLGVLAVTTGHAAFFVLGWVVPLTIASALGAYLFYAQHNYPGVVVATREQWTFSGAALSSSSHMTMGPVMRWFSANIGVHHVHHLNAAIPFYRLPEAMAAIPELQHPGTTALTPSAIRACFALKLWDPDAGKMVGWPG